MADVVLSLKEQPLRLVNQAELPGPVIACLHRSDPQNQGPALEQLRTAVAAGRIAALICWPSRPGSPTGTRGFRPACCT